MHTDIEKDYVKKQIHNGIHTNYIHRISRWLETPNLLCNVHSESCVKISKQETHQKSSVS